MLIICVGVGAFATLSTYALTGHPSISIGVGVAAAIIVAMIGKMAE